MSAAVTLPVGQALGLLVDVDGRVAVPMVVRLGEREESLTRDEGEVWQLAHPRPGDPLPGDPVTLRGRVQARGVSHTAVAAALTARGLLVEVPTERTARIALARAHGARPLGIGLGQAPPPSTGELFGLPGRPLLELPGDDARRWATCVLAADLWSASLAVVALETEVEAGPPTSAQASAVLDDLLGWLPRVVGAGCGYLDTARRSPG